MSLPALLRAYRDYICQAGIVRFEQPDLTVYVAPAYKPLHRQRKAMEMLRHLDVSPRPAQFQRMRGFWAMIVSHQTLSDFMSLWQGLPREGRIELIRRLGATIGMVHSLRHTGTGDIINPVSKPVAQYILGMIRRYKIVLSAQRHLGNFPGNISGIADEVTSLWGRGGGTLVGNWIGFPPVKLWDSGLMIMDLSRARYSEPLLDFVNLRPQSIGLTDLDFFWEYFLQGYCATSELPSDWKERIEILYRVRLLQALAEGRGEKEAVGDWQSKWWEKYNNYL